jgi:two-component system osmolarity sensor histidine kinase EnvZ
MRFSPRSSFARTLLLIVTLLFVSLVTTYLVVLNFAILPSLQQFNKVLAYEVRMLMRRAQAALRRRTRAELL